MNGGYVHTARESQYNENQQKTLVASLGNLAPFDEKTLFNPVRTQLDKILQLKIRNHIRQGCPQIDSLSALQRSCLHSYRGKSVKEQCGRGIKAQGEKKLMTDHAFFEDIIVKMHFIK